MLLILTSDGFLSFFYWGLEKKKKKKLSGYPDLLKQPQSFLFPGRNGRLTQKKEKRKKKAPHTKLTTGATHNFRAKALDRSFQEKGTPMDRGSADYERGARGEVLLLCSPFVPLREKRRVSFHTGVFAY